MKKIRLCQPVYKIEFKSHNFIKEILLDFISKTKSYSSNVDSISSLDWENASDFNREWVIFFLNFWFIEIEEIKNHIGCQSINLQDIWFQQYQKNDSHGWHTHRGNFTGVYYLELSEKSPRTQLIDPFSKREVTIKAKEGDLIIFPSHIKHRAPINNSEKRKTIISWNFEIL